MIFKKEHDPLGAEAVRQLPGGEAAGHRRQSRGGNHEPHFRRGQPQYPGEIEGQEEADEVAHPVDDASDEKDVNRSGQTPEGKDFVENTTVHEKQQNPIGI